MREFKIYPINLRRHKKKVIKKKKTEQNSPGISSVSGKVQCLRQKRVKQ